MEQPRIIMTELDLERLERLLDQTPDDAF
ncbi:MAG: nucleoside diphosphate kinase regulator, partial [Guyparkeria sp.]